MKSILLLLTLIAKMATVHGGSGSPVIQASEPNIRANGAFHGIRLTKLKQGSDLVEAIVHLTHDFGVRNAITGCNRTIRVWRMEPVQITEAPFNGISAALSTTSRCPIDPDAMHFDSRTCSICLQFPAVHSFNLTLDVDAKMEGVGNWEIAWDQVSFPGFPDTDELAIRQIIFSYIIQTPFNWPLYLITMSSSCMAVIVALCLKNKFIPAFISTIIISIGVVATGEVAVMSEQNYYSPIARNIFISQVIMFGGCGIMQLIANSQERAKKENLKSNKTVQQSN